MRKGAPGVGLWLSNPCAYTTRQAARLLYDWMLVDTEHSPIDLKTMSDMVATIIDANGPAPLVRVSWNSIENIKRALDCGAWGVMVPMVNTRAEAEAVVRACKYPPAGERSFGGPAAHLSFGYRNLLEYQAAANEQTMVIVQLETVEAVKNANEILSVPGIDLCFVGPADLHISMGLPPVADANEPVFLEALEKIKAAAKKNKVATGTYAGSGEAAAMRIKQGFQMVNTGNELALLNKVLADELRLASRL